MVVWERQFRRVSLTDSDSVEVEDMEELVVNSNDTTGDTDVELDDEVEDAYASTKAMGDADCEVHSLISFLVKFQLMIHYFLCLKALSKQKKSDCTADIHTISKHDCEHIGPDTGNPEYGHWCTVCQ